MLRRKKQLNFMSLFVVGLTLLLVLAPSSAAFAETKNNPNIGVKDNSLQVSLDYKNESGETLGIKGATLEIYKIANLKNKDGAYRYEAVPSFSNTVSTSDFNGITARKCQALIKKLKEIINKNKITSLKMKTTDFEGKVFFQDLESGIYLVRQVGRQGRAKSFENIVPFLVAVPSYQLNKNGNAYWEYSVTAEPKIDSEESDDSEYSPTYTPPEEPFHPSEGSSSSSERPSASSKEKLYSSGGRSPKTGDDSHISLYGGIGLMATALLISNYGRLKKAKQEEN